MVELVEFISAGLAICGAWLVALQGRFLHVGFGFYLASNVGWIAFSILDEKVWLLVQTLALSGSSILGLVRSRRPRTDMK